MSSKLLVVGSNSFSGSHFASRASFLGYDVLGISRSSQPPDYFLPQTWDQLRKSAYKFSQINLHDVSELEHTVRVFNPKYVVNFAAQGVVAESWDTPLDWYQTNLMSQIELHQILMSLDKLKKYVHVTTPEVYGSTSDWIEEDIPFNPSTPYAASRAACDMHLKTFFEGFNFPVVFTRSANVYGPGQQLYRVIPKAILSCMSRNKMSLHGEGSSRRSFLHVDDMVDATIKICEKGLLGETYHISASQLISIKDLIEKIALQFGLSLEQITIQTPERLGKDTSYMLSSKKLKETLNWEPKVSLNDGLNETIEWINNYYSELMAESWDYIHKT